MVQLLRIRLPMQGKEHAESRAGSGPDPDEGDASGGYEYTYALGG